MDGKINQKEKDKLVELYKKLDTEIILEQNIKLSISSSILIRLSL